MYSFCVWLGLLVSALFSLGTLLFMRPLILLLGADNNTYAYASSYAFFVIACGGVPTVLSNTFAHLIRSVGESKKASLGITVGVPTAIATFLFDLDYIVIDVMTYP